MSTYKIIVIKKETFKIVQQNFSLSGTDENNIIEHLKEYFGYTKENYIFILQDIASNQIYCFNE